MRRHEAASPRRKDSGAVAPVARHSGGWWTTDRDEPRPTFGQNLGVHPPHGSLATAHRCFIRPVTEKKLRLELGLFFSLLFDFDALASRFGSRFKIDGRRRDRITRPGLVHHRRGKQRYAQQRRGKCRNQRQGTGRTKDHVANDTLDAWWRSIASFISLAQRATCAAGRYHSPRSQSAISSTCRGASIGAAPSFATPKLGMRSFESP